MNKKLSTKEVAVENAHDWEDQDNEISCLKEDLAKLQAKEQEQVVEITRALCLRSSDDALSTDFNHDRA